MGWRRRPVLSFLARGNPVNVALGKLLRPGGRPVSLRKQASETVG